jgi:hypothetical protein
MKDGKQNRGIHDEKGSAIVIALFVLALISVFVAIAMSRSSAEAAATGNETAEARAFYAAQGSLEYMTRNFNKKFEVNLKPGTADFADVRTDYPTGLDVSKGGNYTFLQDVIPPAVSSQPVILAGGPFAGLYAKRDAWRLQTTSTDPNGVQSQLTREILNNLVPIFQFGIFYNDDLEFHPGPRFDFGGRVHTNGSLFLQASTGLYFSSKVSTSNFVYTDTSKNGSPWSAWSDQVFIKNASGTYVQLQHTMGSVQAATNGSPVIESPTPLVPLPTAYNSPNWPTNKSLFDGNLVANAPHLKLPIELNSENTSQNLDLVEVIKRGKELGDVANSGGGTVTAPNITAVTTANADDTITAGERYYNKTGIRISLADSRQKLPGCAAATDTTTPACGVRLDGDPGGQKSGAIPSGTPLGYQPVAMQGSPAYQGTKVNGDRLNSGTSGPNREETWIKVETVIYNPTTTNYDTQDITQDFLALGLTERAPNNGTFSITDTNYNATYGPDTGIDSRSIIKLQRFVVPGTQIPATTYMSYVGTTPGGYNYVLRGSVANSSKHCNVSSDTLTTTGADTGTLAANTFYFPNGFAGDNRASMRNATVSGGAGSGRTCVAPFPIEMFDTREGLWNYTDSTFSTSSTYGTNVPFAGVMSMVDVDVANLKKFLDGNWDTYMPTGTPYATATGHVLRGNDIPQPTNTSPKSGGWVVYVADRRGDYDFDGEYDMEDVYGPNDGTLQVGEDINKNGTMQADYTNEAPRYTGTSAFAAPEIAASLDHKYYRRGVRLINAQTIPGIYDTTTPANSKGFTFASENGVYVFGNYNATGVTSVGTPTPFDQYVPSPSSSTDIPASIAGDAVTILSNGWTDANSFVFPFDYSGRQATDTVCRFAMLSGDTITSLSGSPNQGGGDLKMNGGVHNFKRFLEDWSGNTLSYSGSLINLFNSHNNTGPFKCCNKVYNPPNRNWVFDATFLDMNRLPPGTPYFQYIQTTGFQRTNN